MCLYVYSHEQNVVACAFVQWCDCAPYSILTNVRVAGETARTLPIHCWIESHNGSLPKHGDKLPCGFKIGAWLYCQRKALKSQRLEGIQIGALDDAAPGWRSTVVLSPESLHKFPNITELKRESQFTASLRVAATLVAELGRLPRNSGMSANEHQVAGWIAHQRRHALRGKLSIERAQRLDHTLPGWRKEHMPDEGSRRWQNSLASFVARAKEPGRLPTGPSAQWMYKQKRALELGKLQEGRESALDEAVPGWNKLSSRRESVKRTDSFQSTGLPAVSEQAGI